MRFARSLALAALMVRLCTPSSSSGDFRRLSALFSHPVSLVLGRLSFPAYLLAPYVHTLVLALQEQSLFPRLYLIFHVILGNIVITYTAALVLCLLIERPIVLVADWLFAFAINKNRRELSDSTNGDIPTALVTTTTTTNNNNNTTNTSVASLAS